MSNHGVLTIGDTMSLYTITHAAVHKAKVARLLDSGDVVNGTARAITDDHGNFLSRDVDIRDGFLWVTTAGGMEVFWSVAELLPLVASTEFAEYDW